MNTDLTLDEGSSVIETFDLDPTLCEELDAEEAAREARARRTEASIEAWRTTAAERRAMWQAKQSALAEEARQRRAVWMRRLKTAAAAVLVVFVGIVAPHGLSSGLSEGLVDLPVGEAYAATVTSADVVEEAPEASAGPKEARPAIVARGLRTWKDGSHQWIAFEIDTPEPAWMRFRDANGAIALEDMQCFRATPEGHPCIAGRSLTRIEGAVTNGAAPGEWTVELCTEESCDTVTTFDVG